MKHTPGAESFARPLRAVALFVAVIALPWEIIDYLSGNPALGRLLIVRAVQTAIAVTIGVLSSPRRSVLLLQALAFGLALNIVAPSWAVMVVSPGQAWSAVTVITAVLLGAALFAPWSWRWQSSLAGIIGVGTVLVIALGVPRAAFPGKAIGFTVGTLITFGVASVIGSYLADRERRRVAESEARYRGLFESSGDAIAVLDEGGVIREANSRLTALLGRPLAELVGRRLGDFYSAAPRSGDRITREHAAALSGDLRHTSQTLLRADGQPVDVDITFARAEGADHPPLVQAILRDLTERRTIERRQVQEQRLDSLARFAGGIAHQFNNLLGGILTHASLLRADAANQASAAELDEILAAARRGRDLTTELLRFTRHEAITLQATPPAALLDSVAALARAALPQDVVVDVRVPGGIPALAGDADHLIPACLQLVLNARDAMAGRPDRRLTLAAGLEAVGGDDARWPGAAPGRYVRISVTDNGHGMDAATVERVFEPFFTTKPMHRAAGLGLAAVHSVIRDHHGAVRVESAPGRGTTIHLLIPVSVEPAVATAPKPAPPSGGTILVVDDEAIVRSSLNRALTRFGYRVLEAADGGTALAQLQSAQPPVDLVILDLVLPGGGAGIFEVLKSIRPDLKVLVSSGYSPDTENAKALTAKAQGFLPKPYEIAELREAVAKALTEPAPALPRP